MSDFYQHNISELVKRLEDELYEIKAERDDLIENNESLIHQLHKIRRGIKCGNCGQTLNEFFKIPDTRLSDFFDAIRKGEKIHAIKMLRYETDWRLLKSKIVVEYLVNLYEEKNNGK